MELVRRRIGHGVGIARAALRLAAGLAVLAAALGAGRAVEAISPIAVAAPIAGLVIVAGAAARWSRVEEIARPGADLLVDRLALFFVPVTIGVGAQWDVAVDRWWTTLVALVVSSAVGALTTAWLFGRLREDR